MKRNNPHPNSKDWSLRFRLRPYKGQILDPEDLTTYQLITFTRWANEYIHWREIHRITEPTMDALVKEIEDFVFELKIRKSFKKPAKVKEISPSSS
ncbi:hypothetical protein [Bdellovibrio bacteriovorus]|uniref:hypothetical protein n=1 Tax=Bdellovibrio bacteriovorus TaxID=959 RepID=UPI0035A62E84